MKILFTLVTLLALSSTAYAHNPKKRLGKVIVKGPKAELIYNALESEIVTKDREKFSADIKKVASLRCAKLTKKADTTVVKYRCALKGKKARMRRGQGRGNGQGRGRGQGRGHGQGHDHGHQQ